MKGRSRKALTKKITKNPSAMIEGRGWGKEIWNLSSYS